MLLKHTRFQKLAPFVVWPLFIFLGLILGIELATYAMLANNAPKTMFGFQLIYFFFLWLSLSMLLVISFNLYHWYHDSEMMVWFNNANIINNLI